MNKAAMLAAAALMAVNFALSSIPHLQLYQGHISPEFLKWLQQHTIRLGNTGFFSYEISLYPDFILHKIAHIMMYGFLGTALLLALNRSCSAVGWTMLFAFSDEIHQSYVFGRSARFGDVLLDTVAAVLAIVFFYRLTKRRFRQL